VGQDVVEEVKVLPHGRSLTPSTRSCRLQRSWSRA